MSLLKYLPLVILIRALIIIFLIRNYDYPDEYWQGPEVAHKLSYGYGYLTWEWTMPHPIRSHVFPLLMSIPYEILKLLDIHDPQIIVPSPYALQTLLAGLFDWFFLKLALFYIPSMSPLKALFINYSSWFSLAIVSRTYINSTQALLTLISFYLWNLRHENRINDLISRAIVVLCFVMRGTSVMFWAIVWPYELFTMKGSLFERFKFCVKNGLTLVAMVAASIGFAYLWYGRFEFIEHNFFYYNVKLKWSELYGRLPIFSYFYLILPYIIFGQIPLFYQGIKRIFIDSQVHKQQPVAKKSAAKGKAKKQQQQEEKEALQELENISAQPQANIPKLKEMLILMVLIMLFLSTSSHKQSRFLVILLPMYLILCLVGLSRVSGKVLVFGLLLNAGLFYIHSFYGKEGSLKVLRDIRQDPAVKSVLFMVCCHSTPYYSVVHKNIPMRFPTCAPIERIKGNNENSQITQKPRQLFHEMVKDFPEDPTHIVVTTGPEKHLSAELAKYEKVSSYRHCVFQEEIFMGYQAISLYRLKGLDNSRQRKKTDG